MLLNVTRKLQVILTRKYILKVDDTVQSVATNVLKGDNNLTVRLMRFYTSETTHDL